MISERTAKSIARTWLNGYKSKNTRSQYERVLNNFLEMTQGITIDEVEPHHIALYSEDGAQSYIAEKFTHQYRKAGKSDGTIDNYLSIARSFFQMLQANKYGSDLGIDYEYILNVVLSSDGFKKGNVKPVSVMTVKQYEQLHEWLLDYPFSKRYADKSVKYAMVLKFMYTTAIRVDATFNNLKWKNIVFEEDIYGNRSWVVNVLDKGDKINRKPLSEDFYQELKDTMYTGDDDSLIFEGLSKQGFSKLITEFSEEFGGELTPHSIKVGAGTRLYLMTKNPIMVQKFLDHNDLETTMRYIRIDNNLADTGSFILSSQLDVDEIKNISYDVLVDIITNRPELAYAVLSEAKRKEGALS